MEGKQIVETLADRVREYCRALGTPWTYALHRNPYAVAGFLWGLPVPIVAVALVQWAAGKPLTLGDCCGRLFSHPVMLVLAAHPLIFAILFGAFGTIRERKERHIQGLMAQLEVLAQVDGLTGLVNQHHFYRLLPEMASAGAHRGEIASIVMIDLDGLKALNDSHGHAQGDEVLRHVGMLIRKHVRQGDVAARTGGDEFAVFMPRTKPEEAAALVERLRAEIAATPCPKASGEGTLSVSVSMGVADVPAPAASTQEILARADKALYRAKAEGRNRVVTA